LYRISRPAIRCIEVLLDTSHLIGHVGKTYDGFTARRRECGERCRFHFHCTVMKLLLGFVLFLAAASTLSMRCTADSPGGPALSIAVLKNLAYRGVGDIHQPVQLQDGHWQGEPAAGGFASVPTVDLIADFAAYGDLDRDENDEAVVLLHYSSGGSGVFSYLAVVSQREGHAQNVATKFIGDRIQVRDISVRDRRIVADMVVAAPADPVCCPSQKVQGRWKLSGRSLTEVATVVSGKLAIADVGTNEWLLARWAEGESASPASGITLG
jgi:hypothetical protein